MRQRGLGYTLAGVVAAAPTEHQADLLGLALEGASKAQLRERLLSFRKDKPERQVSRAERIGQALQTPSRLKALSQKDRRRVDRLLTELGRLLGEKEEMGPEGSRTTML
ncbi:hypothetical protein [Deinococcus hohokamensis]|uniref:Uncharacterized protein n=1 Tax=Deinococcus hohokamensis TaxID=309883 RepID=A0ABV9I5Z6_9DEIO